MRGSDTGPLDWDRRCTTTRVTICPACLPAQSIRSHHPPSMRLGRPARLAGNCIFLSRNEFRVAPSSFLDPFTWSVRTRNCPLACTVCAVRERRVAGSRASRGRAARPIGSPASARVHTRGPSCPSQCGSKLRTKRATCRRRRRGHLDSLRLPAAGRPAQASLAT
jgi:hypothetical protein